MELFQYPGHIKQSQDRFSYNIIPSFATRLTDFFNEFGIDVNLYKGVRLYESSALTRVHHILIPHFQGIYDNLIGLLNEEGILENFSLYAITKDLKQKKLVRLEGMLPSDSKELTEHFLTNDVLSDGLDTLIIKGKDEFGEVNIALGGYSTIMYGLKILSN